MEIHYLFFLLQINGGSRRSFDKSLKSKTSHRQQPRCVFVRLGYYMRQTLEGGVSDWSSDPCSLCDFAPELFTTLSLTFFFSFSFSLGS